MKTESKDKPSIHLALAAIMRDIDTIAKERKNEQQHFNFRGIDDCYNALHPIFAAHGVTCVPFVEKLEVSVPGVNSKGNNIYRSVVTMGYRFSATDGSFLEAKTVGEGMDYADKATAKALSAAHKYLLLQTFLIPTAELVDADQYNPTVMPREELAALRAAQADALGAPVDIRLSPEEALALATKRAGLKGTTVEDELAEIGKVDAGGEPQVAADQQVAPKEEKKERKKLETKPATPPEPPEGTKQPEEPKKPATDQQTQAATPPKAERNAVFNYTISQLKVERYKEKQLGELSKADLEFIRDKWVKPNEPLFKDNPAKKAEADAVLAALAIRQEEAK